MAYRYLHGAQVAIDTATNDYVLIDPRTDTVLLRWTSSGMYLDDDRDFYQYASAPGQETAYVMGVRGSAVGTTDGITRTNPLFSDGRIVNGPYGWKRRIIYYDDEHGERTLMEYEEGGTLAMVLRTTDSRSVYECFAEGATNPYLRVGVDRTNGHYTEYRHPTSDTNDYLRTSRDGSNEILRVWDPGGSAADYNRQVDCKGLKNQDGVPLKIDAGLYHGHATLTLSANAFTWDCGLYQHAFVSLASSTGNVTCNITNIKAGQLCRLRIRQHAVTPRTIATWTVDTAGETPIYPGGVAYASAVGGTEDVITVYWTGSTLENQFALAFA